MARRRARTAPHSRNRVEEVFLLNSDVIEPNKYRRLSETAAHVRARAESAPDTPNARGTLVNGTEDLSNGGGRLPAGAKDFEISTAAQNQALLDSQARVLVRNLKPPSCKLRTRLRTGERVIRTTVSLSLTNKPPARKLTYQQMGYWDPQKTRQIEKVLTGRPAIFDRLEETAMHEKEESDDAATYRAP